MSVSILAEQLVKAGVMVSVFTTTANGVDELKVEVGKPVSIDGVTTIYFKRITKDHTHFSPSLLAGVWKNVKQYDVVHIHAWWNLVSVLSCFAAIMRGVPVVLSPRGTLSNYSFHNKNSRSKNMIHGSMGRWLLKKSFIHVTSENELSAVKDIVTPKGIFNLPNFIELGGTYAYAENVPSTHLKLIYLSRIEEKKGLDILLNALRTVTVPYQLTIAGDGNADYVNHLKQVSVKNGIADKLNWIGFQQENKFDILKIHDLLILPSHNENFGNVVIESLSVGTPVLISENVGLADYVKENGMGWICQTDATSVSSAINTIYANKDILEDIRMYAPGKIEKDFNESHLVKEYIDMYDKVIYNEKTE
jgi:glycosyltransferase involved in cell wall biosynthesis